MSLHSPLQASCPHRLSENAYAFKREGISLLNTLWIASYQGHFVGKEEHRSSGPDMPCFSCEELAGHRRPTANPG
jgi:hypothetical protein